MPLVGVFCIRLAYMGWFVWARLCASMSVDVVTQMVITHFMGLSHKIIISKIAPDGFL